MPHTKRKPAGRVTAGHEYYFNRGKYDESRSEKRRQQIKEMFPVRGFTTPECSAEERLRQMRMKQGEIIDRLMTAILTSKTNHLNLYNNEKSTKAATEKEAKAPP